MLSLLLLSKMKRQSRSLSSFKDDDTKWRAILDERNCLPRLRGSFWEEVKTEMFTSSLSVNWIFLQFWFPPRCILKHENIYWDWEQTTFFFINIEQDTRCLQFSSLKWWSKIRSRRFSTTQRQIVICNSIFNICRQCLIFHSTFDYFFHRF